MLRPFFLCHNDAIRDKFLIFFAKTLDIAPMRGYNKAILNEDDAKRVVASGEARHIF